MELPLRAKASNAALAKARALYGRRLTAADYRRLAACRTMPQLAAELKALPMYAPTLAALNPPFARRAQLESLLRQVLGSQIGGGIGNDTDHSSSLTLYR